MITNGAQAISPLTGRVSFTSQGSERVNGDGAQQLRPPSSCLCGNSNTKVRWGGKINCNGLRQKLFPFYETYLGIHVARLELWWVALSTVPVETTRAVVVF